MTILNTPSRVKNRIEVIREFEKIALQPRKEPLKVEKKTKKFVICTQEYSGLGWAKLLKDEGFEVVLAYKMPEKEKKVKEYDFVGKGIVDKVPIESVFGKEYADSYFIFDGNYLSDYSEKLRKMGRKVFGALTLCDRMEHDRKYAVDVAKKYGLESPPYLDFKDVKDGMEFLEKNQERAFVFKPDASDQSHLTFVPHAENNKEANRELYKYLQNLKEGMNSYILQERKKGVEVNFEVWFYQGKPFFAFCALENKRKLNKDLGENVGCSQDIVFVAPLESRGVKKTIGKLYPFYLEQKYTGFADANVIIGEKEFWFLEVCNRFGYNSHINLFHSLSLDSFGNIMSDFIEGNISNFYNRFKDGFGASIALYLDHPRLGLPITLKKDASKYFYPYDLYSEGKDCYLAGYDNQVGVICNHDYTIEDSGEGCFNKIYMTDSVSFPDIAMRSDLHKSDYPTAPVKRYRSLEAMKLI